VEIEGWFVEDFTLAELKTLKARERIPELRPTNTRFDGQLEIPTFEEILALIQSLDRQRLEATRQVAVRSGIDPRRPKRIGVYPETKHPTYFAGLGLAMEEPLLDALDRWEFAGPDAPVFIQSFEVGNLVQLRERTHLPLVQLIEARGQSYDLAAAGDSRSYADMLKPGGLEAIAEYADVIGVHKSLIIPRTDDDSLGTPTALADNAHAAGLKVHGWTFRAENHFLPLELRRSAAAGHAALPGSAAAGPSAGAALETAHGDLLGEIQAHLNAGMDGFFTDHPAIGVRARSDSQA
jgi:glycerophosphoryl diester phosphodiesterase